MAQLVERLLPTREVCVGANPAIVNFFKMGQPRPLFKIYRKTVGFRGIRTRIVGLEGEHAVHLTTTTTAQTAIILLSTV